MRVNSISFRVVDDEVNAELVGLLLGGGSLLAQLQVHDVDGTGSETHGSNAASLVGRRYACVVPNVKVLQERSPASSDS